MEYWKEDYSGYIGFAIAVLWWSTILLAPTYWKWVENLLT